MMRVAMLVCLLAAAMWAEGQLTFTPNWGKRSGSLAAGNEACKPGDTILAIYKLIENEAEKLLMCQQK